MSTDGWIVVTLAFVLGSLVAAFYFYMRSVPPLGRSDRVYTAICLSGFVFQALLFYSGAILYLQLAALAAIYFLVLVPLRHRRKSPVPHHD